MTPTGSPATSGAARAAAPGRVNLIGEHLDYLGGRCLSVALEERTTASVRVRQDATVRLRSRGATWQGRVQDLGPGAGRGWAGYVTGVLWALGVDRGVDVDVTSTLPVSVGLSSSAALAVSVALALDEALGLGTDRSALAEVAYRAETEVVGAPTGRLDQLVSLMAEPGRALLVDFGGAVPSWQQVPCRPSTAGVSLLVLNTGERHDMTDGSYARRRAECEEAARLLGVERLTGGPGPDPGRLARLPDVLRRRAVFVAEELARVDRCVEHLRDADWEGVGAVMLAGHEGARDAFEISAHRVDVAVEAAHGAGALGARMTGGGFGGCAIALVPHERVAAVRDAVGGRFAAHGWGEPEVLVTDAAAGAEVLPAAEPGLSPPTG